MLTGGHTLAIFIGKMKIFRVEVFQVRRYGNVVTVHLYIDIRGRVFVYLYTFFCSNINLI